MLFSYIYTLVTYILQSSLPRMQKGFVWILCFAGLNSLFNLGLPFWMVQSNMKQETCHLGLKISQADWFVCK